MKSVKSGYDLWGADAATYSDLFSDSSHKGESGSCCEAQAQSHFRSP